MSALHGWFRGQRVCLHPHITRSFRCQLHVRFPRCATQTQSQVFALNNEVGRDTVKVSGPLKALDCRFRLTLRGLSPYSKPNIRVSLTGCVFQPRPLHLYSYQEQWPSCNWVQTPFLKHFRRTRSTSQPRYHLNPNGQILLVLTRSNEYSSHLMWCRIWI